MNYFKFTPLAAALSAAGLHSAQPHFEWIALADGFVHVANDAVIEWID